MRSTGWSRNATAMAANAVLMMRFDSARDGQTMSEIVAYGTGGHSNDPGIMDAMRGRAAS